MDDDEIEVIDLAPELDPARTFRPRTKRHVSRRIIVIGSTAVALAVIAGAVVSHDRSRHDATARPLPMPSSVPVTLAGTTTTASPAEIEQLASVPSIANYYGNAELVGDGRPARNVVSDLGQSAYVGLSQRGAALLLFRTIEPIIVGPKFDGTREILPGLTLLPDADGRWWKSGFDDRQGYLEGDRGLRRVAFPSGTMPVAKLRDGYLLVDGAHTGLFEWRPGSPRRRLANADARILAISGDSVAWADDTYAEGTVHITDFRAGVGVDVVGLPDAVTARFSPDGTRIAMLVGQLQQSVVLANAVSGEEMVRVVTASGGNALPRFDRVPDAFQPVPFSWLPNGNLTLIMQTTRGYFFGTISAVHGDLVNRVPAPDGLQQLIAIAR